MGGRDPLEAHRVATPLELLFDLTFATCFSLAAAQLADGLAAGRGAAALLGFGFASFAICWAWINFSWFSSAYDTDDWIFRVVTMGQMIGVLVLAIGLPRMFSSVERGERLDNSVIVLGYVIMRVALVFQWLRAAKQDPVRRRACLTYAITIAIAQIGWVMQIVVHFSAAAAVVLGSILTGLELLGPVLAERHGGGTPWHAHHIAERHSLFAIIALGEAVVGTVAALSAVVAQQGWTRDAARVGIAGTGLTFAMWWLYDLLPSAPILQQHRNRAFVWGLGQMGIVTAIVATGAGLRVAADFIERKSSLSLLATVLTVAIPVAVFIGLIYALYYHLVRRFAFFQAWLLIGTAIVMTGSIFAALNGVSMSKCLVVLVFAPTATVVAYELLGYRYQAEALGA
ncbi:MAG TPA: low temperature requirement protein A [bacterium]|nr:low temperature requirement protein A [bacterium]